MLANGVYAQPEDSPALRDDLFPARVFYTDTAHDENPDQPPPNANSWVPPGATLLWQPARVLTSATHMWVFVDSEHGPSIALYAALDDLQGNRRSGFRVTLAPTEALPDPEHPYLIVTRYANCGCGSRLRSFRPFRTMRLIS